MNLALTKRQQQALVMIVKAGSGCLTKNGNVLCAGSLGPDDDSGSNGQQIHSVTWLRLVALGLVTGRDGRLAPTANGELWVMKFGGKP